MSLSLQKKKEQPLNNENVDFLFSFMKNSVNCFERIHEMTPPSPTTTTLSFASFNFLLFKMSDLRLLFLFNLLIDVYPLRLMSESSYQFYLFIMHLIYINGMELHQDVHVCSFCSVSSCGFEARKIRILRKRFCRHLS